MLALGLACAYLYSEMLLPVWAYCLALAYSVFAGALVCLARPLIERRGIQYTRVLFQTYLNKKYDPAYWAWSETRARSHCNDASDHRESPLLAGDLTAT